MKIVFMILSGLLSGLIGGMGMGGGTVLIPVLTLLFKIKQKTAQALNLICFIPMAVLSLIIHFKNGLVKWKNVIFAIVPGLVTCLLGCFCVKIVSNEILRKIFGGFLIILAVFEFISSLKKKD